MPHDAPPAPDDRRLIAREHHAAGRHELALAAMREAVRETVAATDLNDLAVIAAGAGRFDAARAVLRAAEEIAPGDPDVRENLEALGPGPLDVAALRAGSLGPALSPKLLGHLLGSPPPGDERLSARIDRIPSATTPRERWLYHNTMALLWSGAADVFENGPLLGGTTRAACLGMLANPRRADGPRLHTHDWFRTDVAQDGGDADLSALVPAGQLDGLVAQGLATPGALAILRAEGDFEPLVRELHAGQDYSPLLDIHRSALPDAPEDVGRLPGLWAPPPGARYEIAFVDACKSWFGTRWFLERMAPATGPGFLLALQDFGWHTCFWVSAAMGLMLDRARLVAYEGTTYVFEFPDGLRADDVARMPATLEELGGAGVDEVYGRLLAWAWSLDDSWLLLSLSLQHAAALASLGYREEARRRITALAGRPEYAGTEAPAAFHRPMALRLIRQARDTPTYRPDGSAVRL
ncbi:hypothetical protein [Miltoncostaea marina]|uniref:hypothetical protein n=1 Tax=Miltoncostaea marina TaxID=2843215 RepID=UPI001C3C90C3|nr:hypothetical protein [Miltoncostaea marina]